MLLWNDDPQPLPPRGWCLRGCALAILVDLAILVVGIALTNC